MKKSLLLFLLLLTTSIIFAGNEDFSSLFSDWTKALGEISNEEKTVLENEFEKEGVDIDFKGDSFTYDDGTSKGQFGGSWPTNEFTRLIPKPGDGTLMAYSLEENQFIATLVDVEVEDMKSYAQKVKKNGFDKNEEVEDMNFYGMAVYSYIAYDRKGNKIEVAFSYGIGMISVYKKK